MKILPVLGQNLLKIEIYELYEVYIMNFTRRILFHIKSRVCVKILSGIVVYLILAVFGKNAERCKIL